MSLRLTVVTHDIVSLILLEERQMTLNAEKEDQFYVKTYLDYLKSTKKLSVSTQLAYQGDLNLFILGMKKLGYTSVHQVIESDLQLYLLQLKHDMKTSSTIARNIATLRSYFGYLNGVGHIHSNPALNIKSVKPTTKKEVYRASPETITQMLSLPNLNDKNGPRDQVMIQLISQTGIQIMDLMVLTFSDVNLEVGYIRCKALDQRHVPIFIPIDESLKSALQLYFSSLNISDEDGDRPLFGNGRGGGLTRQGIWKIIKRYAQQLNPKEKGSIISPRNLKQQSI